MTGGMALGAPLAGYAIDQRGWGAGFVLVSLTGVVVAVAGAVATSVRARDRQALRGEQERVHAS
jgi:predicted MFS family arabinose efflux permease